MPTVKIVPFPGALGPAGSTGPQGVQGEAGADATFSDPVDWTPQVTATGLVQTSNQATGNYIAYGKMIFVNLLVPFATTTNFGTGQYNITLPFPAARHTDVVAGSIHNTSASAHYSIKGHLADGSSQMSLWYMSGTAKDEPFDYNSPILLATDDLFHMSFWYETE